MNLKGSAIAGRRCLIRDGWCRPAPGASNYPVPQLAVAIAVAATALFTAYLPPIWGWVTLAWMRRREYV
jgi:hypothetical protein